jgi:hypothetical protein
MLRDEIAGLPWAFIEAANADTLGGCSQEPLRSDCVTVTLTGGYGRGVSRAVAFPPPPEARAA